MQMTTSSSQALVSLYRKLGLVVLEQKQDKSLWLLSLRPDWFSLLAQLDEDKEGARVIAITSSFFQSFIEDTIKDMWLNGDEHKVSSMWIEIDSEPPRVYRRLHFLRGWSYEQVNEIFAGSSRAGCTVGV